jgi:hypothetical protein
VENAKSATLVTDLLTEVVARIFPLPKAMDACLRTERTCMMIAITPITELFTQTGHATASILILGYPEVANDYFF